MNVEKQGPSQAFVYALTVASLWMVALYLYDLVYHKWQKQTRSRKAKESGDAGAVKDTLFIIDEKRTDVLLEWNILRKAKRRGR
jgi:hypothetical protein